MVGRCRLDRIGTSSVRTREEIVFLDGAICAEAEAVLVARDIDARASRPLTTQERAAFEASTTVLDHLFEPLALGPATLPNRIVSTSHQTSLVRDHLPTEALVAYHEERARGGVGFVVLEATAVHESGLLHAHTLAGYRDGIADGYRRIAAAVQRHGTRVAVQLFHGGGSRSRARRGHRRSRPPRSRASASAPSRAR